MNCAVHPDLPATAFCRTCGKALCANCARPVRGVIYCEDCLASRLHDTVPADLPLPPPGTRPEGGPSPGLAAVLGFIPGVGAMYNGQFAKAFVHVLIFVSLIWAADREGVFGVFIPFFIFYMVFDAYKTARARETGMPAPDPLGVERMFSPGGEGISGAGRSLANAPVGAIILIGLGFLFLLDNVGLFHFRWIGRMWPLILVVLGVWLFVRRRPPEVQ